MNPLTFSIPVDNDVFCPICCNVLVIGEHTTFQGLVICLHCSSLRDDRMFLRNAKRSYLPSFSSMFDRSYGLSIFIPNLPRDRLVFNLWENGV